MITIVVKLIVAYLLISFILVALKEESGDA